MICLEFFQITELLKQSGAEEARGAHNPEVGGSKPLFAIN